MRRRTRARVTGGTLIATLMLGALVGCAGGGTDASSGADSGSVTAPEPARDGLLGGVDSEGVGTEDKSAGDGVATEDLQQRAVISTGRIELESEDLRAVRAEVDRLLGRWGGYVSDEETYNDDKGRTVESSLTARVPAAKFEDVMTGFDDLATVTNATRQAEDVTTQVIDITSRIRTQEVSLRRLRGFLNSSADLDAVIRLEAEIARREASLESLKAQQAYLADQTSLATITIHMVRPDQAPEEDDPWADAGFLAGLEDGWNALTTVYLVTVTLLGAVLPFLILLTLVGAPAFLIARRSRRTAASRQPSADSSAQT